MDSLISGENFYGRDGQPAGYSADGIFGGTDYYGAGGKRAGYGVPGIFGGENITLDGNPFRSGSPEPDSFGDSSDNGWDE